MNGSVTAPGFPLPEPLPGGAGLTLDSAAAPLARQGCVRLDASALAQLCGVDAAALGALGPLWHDLPPDEFLKDGGHYRRRRHGSLMLDSASGALTAMPHRPHWQPTTYNALHGGLLRHFAPLAPALAQDGAFQALLRTLGTVFARAAHPTAHEPAFDGRWFIETHPFRIDTTGGVGRPTPEGAHRDGVNFVAVILVARHQVRGGESRVFEAAGPHGVRFTLDQPWSALLLDDDRVIHETTPILPGGTPEAPLPGWRDTLVLTYRAGGFQDPPPA